MTRERLPRVVEIVETTTRDFGSERIGLANIFERAYSAADGSRRHGLCGQLISDRGTRQLAGEGSVVQAGGAVWEVVAVIDGKRPAPRPQMPGANPGKMLLRPLTGPPAALPDLTDEDLQFTWDAHPELAVHVIRCGDRPLWMEPTPIEDAAPFEAAARVLRAHYGERVRDLVPTQAATRALYGDSLGAAARVERVRDALRRGEEVPAPRVPQPAAARPPAAAHPPAPAHPKPPGPPVPPRPPRRAALPLRLPSAALLQPTAAPPRMSYALLAQAIARDDAELIAAYLEAGGTPQRHDDDGETLLHVAARHRRAHIVRALLAAGATGAERTRAGETPRDAAAGPRPPGPPVRGEAWQQQRTLAALAGEADPVPAPVETEQLAWTEAPMVRVTVAPDGSAFAAQDTLRTFTVAFDRRHRAPRQFPARELVGLGWAGRVVLHQRLRCELEIVTGDATRVAAPTPVWHGLRGSCVSDDGRLAALVYAEIPDERRPVKPDRLVLGCWSVETGAPLWRRHVVCMGADERTARGVLRFSEDGSRLLSVFASPTGADVTMTRAADGSVSGSGWMSGEDPRGGRTHLHSPLVTADGTVVDATVHRGGIELLEARTLHCEAAVHGDGRRLELLAVAGSGTHAVARTDDREAQLWDLAGVEPPRPIPLPHAAGHVTCVAFSRDGRQFVAGTSGGTVVRGEVPR